MAEKSTRSRPRRRLFGRGADYVALALIAVAAVALAALALSGVSLRPGTDLSPTSRPVSTAFDLPTETPTPTPVAPVSLALLSDQASLVEGTWWSRSVTAALVPGVIESGELAPLVADTTVLTVEELQDRVAAAATVSGYVVVQAGSGDLADGVSPTVVALEVEALLQAIVAKGATPIVALVPPSDEDGVAVVELNGLLQTSAAASGFGVLDLFSPVANANGTWVATFSSDGELPNAAGSEALAQSAIAQLPSLIATK